MPPVVELRRGDLFDNPADLIVLPCSTSGTTTRFVAERLRQYSIPTPRRGMALGQTDIMPFIGAENIAQFVAFAVSVDQYHSNATAIGSIGESLGECTRSIDSVRTISAPLLGAGAGNMPTEIAVNALSRGFKQTAVDSSRLVISVLQQSVLDHLLHADSPTKVTQTRPKSPRRVFISYSGTSDGHKVWVAELGTFLRRNGLDARLDQWHLRPGGDMRFWMENEITLADRVLIISDSRYRDRADNRSGGVGWETKLIQSEIDKQPPDSRRCLVIVREDRLDDAVPKYLQNTYFIHWSSTQDEERLRNDLLKELYELDLAPPIGTTPSLYVLS